MTTFGDFLGRVTGSLERAGVEYMVVGSLAIAGILQVKGDALDMEYIERWVHTLNLTDTWERAQQALPG